MSDFAQACGRCVEGVECLSVTAPHARKGEPVNHPHPPHSSTAFDAELRERMAQRQSAATRRREARAELHRQHKQARDAGLKTRHAQKLWRIA